MVVQNLLWSASFPVTVHLCSPYILYWSFFVYSIYVTNHLNCCLSIIYIINYAFNSWLLPSFLILSFLVTHLILLNYFISVDPFHYLLSHINRSEGNIDDDLFCKNIISEGHITRLLINFAIDSLSGKMGWWYQILKKFHQNIIKALLYLVMLHSVL